MSRNSSKKKKSTSKYRQFKISPLIPVIAIIEVIVLIAISTYAWFIVSQEKEANTGVITVDADSGLDIEFKNANYDNSINLWDNVPDDFEFSPVTSLDGRNVFVPTSGTFGSTDTNDIVFRDATVNDINTKYINVDFMLTNQTENDVNVYLNDNSEFSVYSGGVKQAQSKSRALRMAFYTNDGDHGAVSSSILSNTNQENAALDKMDNTVTVYFNNPNSNKWAGCTPYAYVWKTSGGVNYEAVSWPGSKMTHVAGNVYSYTFSNTTGYTGIIFNNGDKDNTEPLNNAGTNTSTYKQTRDLSLDYADGTTGSNGKIYEATATLNNTGTAYTTKTVYFRKPNDWAGVRAHAFRTAGENNSPSFTSYPGDLCKDCGADIYSYTFPTTYGGNNMNGLVFNNSADSSMKTNDINVTSGNGKLYYFDGVGSGTVSSYDYSERKVYFYNSVGWEKPYAKLKSTTGHITRVAMTNLSSGVYYATVPSVYIYIDFEERKDLADGADQNDRYKKTRTSVNYSVSDGYIYRPGTNYSDGYALDSYSYTDYVGEAGDTSTYAVVSPGISAGFQRAYTPVVSGTLRLFQGQLSISYVSMVTVAACIIIMIALTLFTSRTRMGKAMRACSEDKGAAQLMGINVNFTISLTFAIGSALAAVAGVLLCSFSPTLMPTTGSMPGIKAFTAAVFGGIGSIPGAFLGGILLGVIESLARGYISTQLSNSIVFAVLIIILLVRPAGLLGKNVQEKV